MQAAVSAEVIQSVAVIQRLIDLVYPRSCAFCGDALEGDEKHICNPCTMELPWIVRACRCCAVPLMSSLASEFLCADCQDEAPAFDAAVAPLRYEFPVDAAIKALKFRKQLHYAPALAEILLSTVGRLPGGIDAVLPVPLHAWRFMRRGFNQAHELSVPVARELGVPVIDVVKRASPTPYQSGLNAKERRRNLATAFRAKRRIDYENILVVDDVITTGETCEHIARTLKAAGAKAVSVLAVARTP